MLINESKISEALDKYDHLNKKFGPIGENRNVVIEMLLGDKKEFKELESPAGLQSGLLPDKKIPDIPAYFTKEFITFLLNNSLRCLTDEQRHALTTSLMVRDEKICKMVKKLENDVDTLIKLGFELRS